MRTGGIFYFPLHRHQIEGTNGFYCLIRKTLASGVNGIAKVPKRKVFTDEVGLEPSNVRSPVDALTHLATAPPTQSFYNGMNGIGQFSDRPSEPFDIRSSVKQGCVLVAVLCSLDFTLLCRWKMTSTQQHNGSTWRTFLASA